MSTIRRSAVATVAMSLAMLPTADATISGGARTRVEGLCRAAVASVADPRNASLEIRQKQAATSSATSPITPAVVNWYRSEIPGRFVVLLSAVRTGAPVQIRAIVELKGAPCHLVSWRVL